MTYVAGVLRPHDIGLGLSINSNCEAGPYSSSDPSCDPAYRDTPWAAVLTDMGTYEIGAEPAAWARNGTRGSCPPVAVPDPEVMPYCGFEGQVLNVLQSPLTTVHAQHSPQLSPAMWIGQCYPNGTTRHGWTQRKLRSFLSFLDSQNITRIGLWCMDPGNPNFVGFPCVGLDDVCPWFYEELETWKARPITPMESMPLESVALKIPRKEATLPTASYQLKDSTSGLCLTVAQQPDKTSEASWSCSAAVKCTPAVMSPCDAAISSRQLWMVTGEISNPLSFVLDSILLAHNPNFCLSIVNGSSAAGAPAVLAPCGLNAHTGTECSNSTGPGCNDKVWSSSYAAGAPSGSVMLNNAQSTCLQPGARTGAAATAGVLPPDCKSWTFVPGAGAQ